MIILDVNVVVAAFRPDHPHHERAAPWMERRGTGTERFAVPDTVWVSFLRLVTNRRIFEEPDTIADAFEFVRAVRSSPTHQVLTPSTDHLELLAQTCADGQASGDLVPDAYLAALAIDQGAKLATFDRDFARFGEVRTVEPSPTGEGD